MKYFIYLIERTDYINYDEYNSIIVSAENEIKALSMTPEYGHWSDIGNDEKLIQSKLTCIKIGSSLFKEKVIHESYNAG